MKSCFKNFGNNIPFIFFLFALLAIALSACEKDNESYDEMLDINILSVDYLTQSSATFTGDIFTDMEKVEELGFCWSDHSNPEITDNQVKAQKEIGLFTVEQSGFVPGTKYFVRAYYIKEKKVFYSNELSFELPEPAIDYEGNEYATVRIGNQIWFAENLNTIFYTNGNLIDNGTGIGNYKALHQPRMFFNYDDDEQTGEKHGKLYTWYTVMDNRGLCPTGWKVPDRMDWFRLSLHLDVLSRMGDLHNSTLQMSANVGGLLKAAGTHDNSNGFWQSPNSGPSIRSNLNLLPSGYRDSSGFFDGLGWNGIYWSSSSLNTNQAPMFYAHFNNTSFYAKGFSKHTALAVRCMKNI